MGSMLSDVVDAVIGVDTHVGSYAVAVCGSSGAVLAAETTPAGAAGAARVWGLAAEHAPWGRVVFAVEGDP